MHLKHRQLINGAQFIYKHPNLRVRLVAIASPKLGLNLAPGNQKSAWPEAQGSHWVLLLQLCPYLVHKA